MPDHIDQYGLFYERCGIVENIRQYIFTLICMAILCGLVPEFFENNSLQKKLLKFAAGLLMMIVAVTPLTGKERLNINWMSADLTQEAQAALSSGQEQADGMIQQIIIQRTQAYILDKATSMGAELSVEVHLSDAELPAPESVVLTGAVSPYAKKQLSKILVSDLSISEDKLQWNY